jgi:tetratricopeptide (TPR) repeat protein
MPVDNDPPCSIHAPALAAPHPAGSDVMSCAVGGAGEESDLDQAGAALAAGRLQAASDLLRTVLARDPGHPRALGMLGQLAILTGQHEAALQPLQRAAARDGRLEFRIWLCLCLERLGRRADALGLLGDIIDTLPRTANAHFAVGLVLDRFGCLEHAVSLYEACIGLDPDRADARHRYARALQATGRLEAAIDAYGESIRRCGTNADVFADLSAALSAVGRFEDACDAGRISARLDARGAEACNNVGHALLNLNRSAEAVGWYAKAIAIREDYATARFGHAVALLKSGDFARGWREYEWRWRDCQTPRTDLDVPAWQGEAAEGRTILLHAEQGLGDTLQFVRFASEVAERGVRVVIEVPRPLVRLLQGVAGVSEAVACGDPVPPVDLHCPMASLPMLLGLRIGTIPATPYLHVAGGDGDVAMRKAPRRTIARTGAVAREFVVGLVWAGDPRKDQLRSNLIDRRRSMNLDMLSPLFGIEGVRFLSFQLGEARDQIAVSGGRVADAMEGVQDFADTAARLSAVDLLISVDTSMVHLAGGLGLPVWMMSRFDGCWRWLEGRSDTPWYPSMRIFRQPAPGDWPGLVTGLRAALVERVGVDERRRTAPPQLRKMSASSLRGGANSVIVPSVTA